MMYQEKFVVAIKVNGKILRERGDVVSLPYGTEYVLLVKNLHSVRSQISVSIDGQDAVGQIILQPNSSVELERFVRNGNLDSGNRFKFIERTSEIESHRGARADDGIVRVEAFKERVQKFEDVPYWPYYGTNTIDVTCHSPEYTSRTVSANINSVTMDTASCSTSCSTTNTSTSGITVPGSVSQQRFHATSGFALEYPSTVIVLRLQGSVGEQPIERPITVDVKPECSVCGKRGNPSADFCDRCGSALVLV